MTSPWLPAGFEHPQFVPITADFHLRPIRATDAEIDLPVVNANREMLWHMYGEAWGWPSRELELEEDRQDLAHHEQEAQDQQAFNYAILSSAEDRLLGCVYLDPLDTPPTTAPGVELSWWMDAAAPKEWRQALDEYVPVWVARDWPFRAVTTPFQHLNAPKN